MRHLIPKRCGAASSSAAFPKLAIAIAIMASAAQAQVVVTNLVTDDQTANPALLTDPSLRNAWGTSFSSSGPFWVSDNAAGVATLYDVDPLTNAPTKVGLTVTIPGAGTVTGETFNGAPAAFNGDNFLFVSEDGTISGWRGALGTTAEILQSPSAAVYKGITVATAGGNAYLYAANFSAGSIDILKGSSGAPDLTGHFVDPNLPAGYAPFNVQNLNGTIYVTYALQAAGGQDDSPARATASSTRSTPVASLSAALPARGR